MNQNMIYDVSYMDALKRGFKQYVTFSGRASRSEFWRFMVCREIILDGLAGFGLIVDMVLGNTSATSDYAMVLLVILQLVFFLPSLAITCRRLHDVGKSGLTFLLVFIPIVGIFVLLSNLVKKGVWGKNRVYLCYTCYGATVRPRAYAYCKRRYFDGCGGYYFIRLDFYPAVC